jgi:SAM-dependent methyltransferase
MNPSGTGRKGHDEFEDGGYITGRIHTVARLFRTHQGRARALLDIGCGTGMISIYLASVLGGAMVYGVDANRRWAERARITGTPWLPRPRDSGREHCQRGPLAIVAACGEGYQTSVQSIRPRS